MKTCIKCNIEKEQSEFYSKNNVCRDCVRKRKKELREEKLKDPEYVELERQKSRDRYKRNPEKALNNQKEKRKKISDEKKANGTYKKLQPDKFIDCEFLVCYTCKENKPKNNYHKNKKICKCCVEKTRKRDYEKNEEKRKEKIKNDDEKHKEDLKLIRERNKKKYEESTHIKCSCCGETKTKDNFCAGNSYCKDCKYEKQKNNPKNKEYRARSSKSNKHKSLRRIRNNFNTTIRLFGERKKTKRMKEYSIDLQAIYDKIGPRPGTGKDWHLDHIIPCSKFDWFNEEHISLCNSPENLRWLKSKKNLEKHDNLEYECFLDEKLLDIAEKIGLDMDKIYEELKKIKENDINNDIHNGDIT